MVPHTRYDTHNANSVLRKAPLCTELYCRALVKFDISGNGIDAEGIELLAGGLKDNHLLTELNVAQNLITFSRILGGSSAEMFGILALLDTVKTMPALSRLNLSKNKICTKESGQALALTLKMNSALKELDVSHNVNYMYIGNDVDQNFTKHPHEFIYALCEGLSATKSLSKLIMTNNNIVGVDVAQTRAAGKALGDAIAVNATLNVLDLSKNALYSSCKGAEFAFEFAVGLKKNARLLELNLVNCNLTNDGLDMAGTVLYIYVYIYVCMYVCMYVCIYVCM
jgi:Leucine-rich repeat (LRR) protein